MRVARHGCQLKYNARRSHRPLLASPATNRWSQASELRMKGVTTHVIRHYLGYYFTSSSIRSVHVRRTELAEIATRFRDLGRDAISKKKVDANEGEESEILVEKLVSLGEAL